MNIGRKMLVLQITLLVSFLAVIFAITHYIWGENYLKLEQNEVNENVLRSSLAWSEEIDSVSSLVEDWAPWDELYSFVSHPDEPFIENNLTDSAMANLKINAVIITDRKGNIRYAKAIDLDRKIEIPIPKSLINQVHLLVSKKEDKADKEKGISGFIMSDEYPIFVALQEILPSDKRGEKAGFLIFSRFANEDLMNHLSKKTQVKVNFFNGSITPLVTDPQFEYQQTIGENTIAAYYPITDIYGHGGSYLVNHMPRDIFKQGQLQTKLFLALTVMFGMLFLTLTILLLHKIVFAPLSKIENFMNTIIKDSTTSLRLDLPGNDEFSKIAVIFNDMLSQIEIRELYKSAKQELEGRKRNEAVLKHMSYHDSLTGLFNRTYFQEQLGILSEFEYKGVGVVCCDVDGLKIINDTMGHSMGDIMLIQVARVLTDVFPSDALVARIGGDEFSIILTDIDESNIRDLCRKIPEQLEKAQSETIKMKLSVGWSWCNGLNMSVEKFHTLLKEADDLMYRNKLSSSKSNRNALVQGMMEMLKARDFITEGHSQRIQEYVMLVGRELMLSDRQIADLCLLAQFHDIGKIGVSDTVLFKTGMLTGEERKEIERHSVVGYRIAQAIPELLPIADFILKHHEWWNGRGYPLGLHGEEIPIENRIIAIADAFDAMTNDRPYRLKMSIPDALAELKKFAGIQFDPELVNVFTKVVNENN